MLNNLQDRWAYDDSYVATGKDVASNPGFPCVQDVEP